MRELLKLLVRIPAQDSLDADDLELLKEAHTYAVKTLECLQGLASAFRPPSTGPGNDWGMRVYRFMGLF